jgi:hypothetical protein
MNKLKYLGAVLIAVAGLGLQQAQATLDGGTQFSHKPFMGPQAERDFLVNNGFMEDCCRFFYKHEAGGTETNPFITVTELSSSTWQVTWDFTGTGLTLCGALIKDGTSGVHSESIYSFFSVIDGEDVVGSGTVEFTGDFAGRGISHISFFVCGAGVPDGGTTVMLLGAALSTLGVARRFFFKS